MSETKPKWTAEQIYAFNLQQSRHDLHPMTCGNDCLYDATGMHSILVGSPDGPVCKTPGCGYVQGVG